MALKNHKEGGRSLRTRRAFRNIVEQASASDTGMMLQRRELPGIVHGHGAHGGVAVRVDIEGHENGEKQDEWGYEQDDVHVEVDGHHGPAFCERIEGAQHGAQTREARRQQRNVADGRLGTHSTALRRWDGACTLTDVRCKQVWQR